MSVFNVRCPGCQATLKIPATAAGTKVRCTQCKKVLAIPAAATAGKSSSPPAARPAAVPKPIAKPVANDPVANDPFASAPLSTTPNAFSPRFATAPQQPDVATPKQQPKWLIPVIAGGVLLMLGGVAVVGAVLVGFGNKVSEVAEESRQQQREATMLANQQSQQELSDKAAANPLPSEWTEQGSQGVKVRMPPDAAVREIPSPAKGPLVFQVEGGGADNKSQYRLLVMPLGDATEIKRDQWLRNFYQYSGADVEELLDVVRGGVAGKRLRLVRSGEFKDPLIEFFQLRDRIVIASVTPPGSQHDEAFFDSLRLPDPSTSSKPTPDLVADANVAAQAKEEPQLSGAERKRKQIYLEYRQWASANSNRKALPGISARDAVDRLVGDINESQIQQFLILKGLSEKELNEIISEGSNKQWAP